MTRKLCLTLFPVALLLACWGAQPAESAKQLWALPKAPEESGLRLPRLADKLTLDGDLNEWSSAAWLAMTDGKHVVFLPQDHKWAGAADSGMECYAAWTPDGLCAAAVVMDDDVSNDRSDADLWQRDCVEIFVDGRVEEKFHQKPYSPGAYHIMVKPPLDGQPPKAVVDRAHGTIDGLQAAGKRTKTGYTIELLIPWSAFADFKAADGASMGLSFQLDDYDKRDGDIEEPLYMVNEQVKHLSAKVHRLTLWKLIDSTDAQVTALLPAILVPDTPLRGTLRTSSVLGQRAAAVRVELSDPAGKVIHRATAKLTPAPQPWIQEAAATVELPTSAAKSGDGSYTCTIDITDKNGKSLGRTTRLALSAQNAVSDLQKRMRAVDVARVSQTDPFRATAYLGAASQVEILPTLGGAVADASGEGVKKKYPRYSWTLPVDLARYYINAMNEAQARLDVLESGKTDFAAPCLYDLLNLSAEPKSQLVVEYPVSSGSPSAGVTLYWGAFPMISAEIDERESEEAAQKVISDRLADWPAPWSEQTTVAGMPGVAGMVTLTAEDYDLADYSPDRQLLGVSRQYKSCSVLPFDGQRMYHPDAVAILENCPQAAREAAQAWATKINVPVLPLEEALKKTAVVMAGPIPDNDFGKELRTYNCRIEIARPGFASLRVAWGKRVITICSSVRPAAEHFLSLIISGKPVTPEDADSVRSELVKALAPIAAGLRTSQTEGQALYAGELHSHTIYSDGATPPVSFALHMLECFMDFGAITDHNTIEGAQLAQSQLKKFGFDFPLIVGEEVTTWYHMNAYPVKENITPPDSVYEATKAAHRQGAATQWNHPGYPETEWANKQMKKDIEGTGFDAWEHVPPSYDKWLRDGKLPTLVGTSDTHSACFAYAERTAILSPSLNEDDVAECVRCGQTTIVSPYDPLLLYGRPDMTGPIWAALSDGKALKDAKAERIRQMLGKADLAGLLGLGGGR